MAYSLTYTYNSASQSYSVTGYSDITTSDKVVIPDKYDDGMNGEHPVTSIGIGAFYNCSSLTSVTISDSVTSISSSAFESCSSLTSVTIGNSVNNIGYNAFSDCSSLIQLILFPSTPPTLSSNAIPTTVQSIYVQQSSKAAYQSATNWTAFASKIVSDNIYLSFVRFNQKNKEYINEKVEELSATANLENGTGTGSLVQKTVSSSGTPYANEASGSGAVAMGKKVKSKGNTTFVIGQENEAIVGTSASFTSGRLNVNRGSYNITGGENNANNNSWNLVIAKNSAVSDGRFGIVSGLDNVYTGPGDYKNTAVSMLGKNLYVQGENQPTDGALLIGQYNRVQNNPGRLFIVGNGNSAEDRKNAFEVLADGRAKVQSAPVDDDDVVRKQDLDKPYELIEEITLTENTSAIERTTEPDGTLYNFKKLKIFMDFNGNTLSGSGWLQIETQDYYSIYYELRDLGMYEGATLLIATFEANNNMWDGRISLGRNSNYATSIETTYRYKSSLSLHLYDNKNINKVRLYGMTFVTGIKIKIYGVRA